MDGNDLIAAEHHPLHYFNAVDYYRFCIYFLHLFRFQNCVSAISESNLHGVMLVLYMFKQRCNKSDLNAEGPGDFLFERSLHIIQGCCRH